jgi:hypothetical protein
MNPNKFTDIVQSMTLENGFESFICLKRLSCGSDDAGDRHMSFIVSIVSLETHTRLSKNNDVVKSDLGSHQLLVEMMDVMFKIHMWKGLWSSEDRYFPEFVNLL